MSSPGTKSNAGGRPRVPLGFRFMLLALGCISAMLLDHREDHLTTVRQVLSMAIYPVQWTVNLPFEIYSWASNSIADRADLLARNEELSRALLDSAFQLQQLETLKVENTRLRYLLESTAKIDDRSLVAEILSVDLDPYRQRFVLNRGAAHNVFVGQAILDRDGVVGQIVEVGRWSAEAVLITDADHAIPVVVNRNGLRTIAVGTGDQGRLRLPYLTNSADIEVGDLLVSSGLGEVFPAGYPVGRIVQIQNQPGQPFAEITVAPVSALDRDQEVLLVFNDSQRNSGRDLRIEEEPAADEAAETPPPDVAEVG